MYQSIYKKIALPAISLLIFYSMTSMGADLSYGVTIKDNNIKQVMERVNNLGVLIRIKSIKAMKDDKSQPSMKNYQLSINMKSLKMSSIKSPLVITSLRYDSEGLSNKIKMSFSEKPKASKKMSYDITINSIQSKSGKLLVDISCSSDVGSHDKDGKKKAAKSFGSSRKGSMNKGSRQSGSDNFCGLSKNKKLFVTLYQ